MKHNNICIFGGSSGLAKKTIPYMDYNSIKALSSKDCDVRNYDDVLSYVKNSNCVIYFSVVNYDNLISNIKHEDIQHSLDVNIKGYINVLKACAENWKETGGKVIYLSSILSSNPIKGVGMYASCKSFCETMTKVFAMENGKYNMTANVLQLGYFDGGLTYKVPEKVLDNIKNIIPNKCFGSCEDLGKSINMIFDNSYLNGSIIKISGGL
jgi:3-oxoacyl-[acyl-carrier protein] reductase